MMVDRLRQLDDAFAEAGIDATPEVRFGHAVAASLNGRPDEAEAKGVEAINGALEAGDRHYAGLASAMFAMIRGTNLVAAGRPGGTGHQAP